MKKLTLYIAWTVLYTSFIMILAVSTIFFLFTYIAQASYIGEEQYSAFRALLYVLYSIPANLYLIMPVCGLLGALMGLGLLSQNSELIVIRASGQSIFDISKGIILTATLLAVLTFFMGAYIAPFFQKKAIINKIISTKGNNNLVFSKHNSLWIQEGNSFIHINYNKLNNRLTNIIKFNILNNKLTSVSYGKNALYQDNKWKVNDIKEIFIYNKTSSLEKSLQQYWNLFPPSILQILISNTNCLNLSELFSYICINYNDSQKNSKYIWLKFWQILFQPFSLLILMLLSVPFSLGSIRSLTIGLGYRFMIGMIVGFTFYICNQMFGPFSLVYNFNLFLGAAIPSLIFLIILGFLFWKIK